jgi:hypothetical protein
VIALAISFLPGCQAQETELEFETIEKRDWFGSYEDHRVISDPRLIFIDGEEDIAQLEKLVSPEALDELDQLDFQQYFAIGLFRDLQPSCGYDTLIERVTWRGDKIFVYGQFWDPNNQMVECAEVKAPYHLVRVQKDAEIGGEIELVLRSRTITPTPP